MLQSVTSSGYRRARSVTTANPAETASAVPAEPERFVPKAVRTIREAGLPDTLVEALIFKTLLAGGNMSSREVARATALPGKPVLDVLSALKMKQLVHYSDSGEMGDFEYALTDAGRERAFTYMKECAYVGPAPVTLPSYIDSVSAQGITSVHPKRQDLERAFGDLLISSEMFRRLGPAINSGRGLFLYGFPGNGKTSIAERITDCFGDSVWIPYALFCGGEIITVYDPESHQLDDSDTSVAFRGDIDPRWVRIRRPTIVVGGELTLEALDICHNHDTNIAEAPLQLKSNTGTLVIDDFGRQRVSPMELLNRWIVPLEKRYDFLALANGKKIKVPFDQLIIFSTNLEPKDLVDEAFLRRIPYKINIVDPTEEEFRKLFEIVGPRLGVEVPPGAIDHLIDKHYRAVNRPFRCCHPRDLLLQVLNSAVYEEKPAVATPEALDAACSNYFAII